MGIDRFGLDAKLLVVYKDSFRQRAVELEFYYRYVPKVICPKGERIISEISKYVRS